MSLSPSFFEAESNSVNFLSSKRSFETVEDGNINEGVSISDENDDNYDLFRPRNKKFKPNECGISMDVWKNVFSDSFAVTENTDAANERHVTNNPETEGTVPDLLVPDVLPAKETVSIDSSCASNAEIKVYDEKKEAVLSTIGVNSKIIEQMIYTVRTNDERFYKECEPSQHNIDTCQNSDFIVENADSPDENEIREIWHEYFETSDADNVDQEIEVNTTTSEEALSDDSARSTEKSIITNPNQKNRLLNKCREFANVLCALTIIDIANSLNFDNLAECQQKLKEISAQLLVNTQSPDVKSDLTELASYFVKRKEFRDGKFAFDVVANKISEFQDSRTTDPTVGIFKQFLMAPWLKKKEKKKDLRDLLDELKNIVG